MTGKPKILLLVEGAETEPKFFRNFAKRLGLDASVYSVKTNIYSLYALLRKEDFLLDVKEAAAILTHSQADKTLLAQKYQCIYLIYDCDAQHTRSSWLDRLILFRKKRIAWNFKVLGEMARYFKDEYDDTVGKLLLNYPMMESYADTNAFFMEEYKTRLTPIQVGRKYKRMVTRRVLSAKRVKDYDRGDFADLVAQNIFKLAYMVTGEWQMPTFSAVQKMLNQEKILSLQRNLAVSRKRLWVLNTSLLLPLVLYKEEAGYFSEISKPRRKKSIAVVLPVLGTVKARHVDSFLKNMQAQSFKEWECLVVVPRLRNEEFEFVFKIHKKVRLVVVEEMDVDDCIGLVLKGVKAASAEYIVPCIARDVPVSTSLITIAGLLQVYPKCDWVMFKRGRRLTWSGTDSKWPEFGNNPAKYPLKQHQGAREACIKLVQDMSIFGMCFKRELLLSMPEMCSNADFMSAVTAHAEFAVKTDIVLFIKPWYC